MKTYLAGKVSKNGWRHPIVKGLGDCRWEHQYKDFPLLHQAIFGQHTYCGPYYIACDHGCWHSCPHASVAPLDQDICSSGDTPPKELSPKGVFRRAIRNIKDCDMVFAWIDSADCYGTLFEIGHATALKKKVVIAIANSEYLLGVSPSDLWFMTQSVPQKDVLYCKPELYTEEELRDLSEEEISQLRKRMAYNALKKVLKIGDEYRIETLEAEKARIEALEARRRDKIQDAASKAPKIPKTETTYEGLVQVKYGKHRTIQDGGRGYTYSYEGSEPIDLGDIVELPKNRVNRYKRSESTYPVLATVVATSSDYTGKTAKIIRIFEKVSNERK